MSKPLNLGEVIAELESLSVGRQDFYVHVRRGWLREVLECLKGVEASTFGLGRVIEDLKEELRIARGGDPDDEPGGDPEETMSLLVGLDGGPTAVAAIGDDAGWTEEVAG